MFLLIKRVKKDEINLLHVCQRLWQQLGIAPDSQVDGVIRPLESLPSDHRKLRHRLQRDSTQVFRVGGQIKGGKPHVRTQLQDVA